MHQSLHSRSLQSLYPIVNDGRGFVHPLTHIDSRVIHYTHDDVLYWIDSPSSSTGERTYPLRALEDFLACEDKDVDELSFLRGKVGETIARIHIEELFRRKKDYFGIEPHGFLKRNGKNSHIPCFESGEFKAFHKDRYNVEVFSTDESPLTEYDGVFQYTNIRNGKPGVVICEAKTGGLDYFGSVLHSQSAKEKVIKRIVEPARAFFPDADVDLLLIAPHNRMYQIPSRNQVFPRITALHSFLQQFNIGLIALPYNQTTRDLNGLVNRVRTSKTLRNTIPTNGQKVWEKKGKYVFLFKGRRLEALFLEEKGKLEQVRVREQFFT